MFWFEFSGHMITVIHESDSANDCSETKTSKSWALLENNVLLLFFIRLLILTSRESRGLSPKPNVLR